MNGIIVVDKPEGYTSRDVVNLISKEFQTKKVGHTGTLDPLATGVLVVCVGDYTKFVSKIANHDKTYLATIQFGYETDTLDITGMKIKESSVIPTKETLLEVLKTFIGPQEQEVPAYSAKKVHGKKLYEYARAGKKVSLPVVPIEIYDLQLLHYENSIATISCSVSKGTYIRSLIRDIAYACNTVGVMKSLRRIQVGNFSITDSNSLIDVQNGQVNLLTFRNILEFETYELNDSEYYLVSHRNELKLPFTASYILLIYQTKEIALYIYEKQKYRPILMFDKNDSIR